jgi:hypothetical protein
MAGSSPVKAIGQLQRHFHLGFGLVGEVRHHLGGEKLQLF